MLCRVRERSSIQRNSWEDQINVTCSHEPADGYVPKLNELWRPSNENQNVDMAKSYLFNDFPLLPYIFASQDLPFSDTTSSISFQSTDKSRTHIQEANNSDKENLQTSFSSIETLFNPLKRKSMEGGNQATIVPPSKKLIREDNNFSPDQWNPFMQYPGLNLLDFTETD